MTTEFESGKGVLRSSSSPGPDDARGEVVRLPFACGVLPSPQAEPPRAIGDRDDRADGRKLDEPRSAADDERVCLHEASHASVGRILGQPLGGVTCDADPAGDYSGRCWGPEFESKFASGESAPSLCAKIARLMPKPGEPRGEAADVFALALTRITELVAGTEGERLFLPGAPWFAVDDERQALAFALLITSSPAAAAALVDACRVEAATLLRSHEHIVRALADQLQRERTMDGAAIDQCIARAVAANAAEAERKRRADWQQREANALRFIAEKARAPLN
jgi:hypothetical protein